MRYKKVYLSLILVGTISIILNLFHIRICSFYYLTGIPCPGCGMTRGFIELFKLNIKKSIDYNILCIPIFLVVLIYFLLVVFHRENYFYEFLNNHRVIIIVIALGLMTISFIKNINNPLLY